MTELIRTVNFLLLVVFSCCYAYQLIYLIVGLVKRDPTPGGGGRFGTTALPC